MKTEKQYRTPEQFHSIVSNCKNGNWSDAARDCIEYGFYANDLVRMNEQAKNDELFYTDELGDTAFVYPFDELTDIAFVVEIATEMRYQKDND